MMKHGKRGIMALLFMTALAILGTSVPASAATGPDGFTILYASQGNIAHQCNVIGQADGYQAVVCADVLTGTGSTYYWIEGQVEAYCQTTSGVAVRCAQVDAAGRLSSGTGGDNPVGTWVCGHQYGQCSAGRNTIRTAAWYIYSASGCASSASAAVWMVAWGGLTQIELPVSDEWVTLGSGNANDGSNESSGHVYVCA
jgi:hypothetical protein